MSQRFYNFSQTATDAPPRQCVLIEENGERCGKMFVLTSHQRRRKFCCNKHQQRANAIRAKERKRATKTKELVCDTCEGEGWIMTMECYGGAPTERMAECPDCNNDTLTPTADNLNEIDRIIEDAEHNK